MTRLRALLSEHGEREQLGDLVHRGGTVAADADPLSGPMSQRRPGD